MPKRRPSEPSDSKSNIYLIVRLRLFFVYQCVVVSTDIEIFVFNLVMGLFQIGNLGNLKTHPVFMLDFL